MAPTSKPRKPNHLKRVLAAVGSDVDTRGNIRAGSILIDRMTVVGE